MKGVKVQSVTSPGRPWRRCGRTRNNIILSINISKRTNNHSKPSITTLPRGRMRLTMNNNGPNRPIPSKPITLRRLLRSRLWRLYALILPPRRLPSGVHLHLPRFPPYIPILSPHTRNSPSHTLQLLSLIHIHLKRRPRRKGCQRLSHPATPKPFNRRQVRHHPLKMFPLLLPALLLSRQRLRSDLLPALSSPNRRQVLLRRKIRRILRRCLSQQKPPLQSYPLRHIW